MSHVTCYNLVQGWLLAPVIASAIPMLVTLCITTLALNALELDFLFYFIIYIHSI